MPATIKVKVKSGGASTGKNLQAHHPKSSQTLMRSAVSRPQPSFKRQFRAIGAAEYGLIYQPTKSAKQIRAHKVKPSQTKVEKSPLVRHFADVKPVTHSHKPKVALSSQSAKASPAQVLSDVSATTFVDKALEKATGYKPSRVPDVKPKKKLISNKIWLSSLVLFMLICIFASQRIENMQNNKTVAVTTTGSSLPAYVPAGFKLSHVSDTTNKSTAYYSDKTTGQAYNISEQPSLWGSSDLKTNYVNNIDPSAVTKNDGGEVVYLYGNEDATWVNNSIWYVIDSNGQLMNSQLLDIAKSS
jgi:hypothetical protein